LVRQTFIPNLKNPEVKALFQDALAIFTAHQGHAAMMVKALAKRYSLNQ
jgi:putative membrane protein